MYSTTFQFVCMSIEPFSFQSNPNLHPQSTTSITTYTFKWGFKLSGSVTESNEIFSRISSSHLSPDTSGTCEMESGVAIEVSASLSPVNDILNELNAISLQLTIWSSCNDTTVHLLQFLHTELRRIQPLYTCTGIDYAGTVYVQWSLWIKHKLGSWPVSLFMIRGCPS